MTAREDNPMLIALQNHDILPVVTEISVSA
jgi:hypothetical protein